MTTPLITRDTTELHFDILEWHRARRAKGESGPTIVFVMGRAAGGKSTAAAALRPKLASALGVEASLVAHVEDDYWLNGNANSRTRGWTEADYRFAEMEAQVLLPAVTGTTITFTVEDWATHEVQETITLHPDVEIILLVGRFTRQLVETYAHFVIWASCSKWNALWRGARRSLKSRFFMHLLYWPTWSRKDDEHIADEVPLDLAHAVLDTSSRAPWFRNEVATWQEAACRQPPQPSLRTQRGGDWRCMPVPTP